MKSCALRIILSIFLSVVPHFSPAFLMCAAAHGRAVWRHLDRDIFCRCSAKLWGQSTFALHLIQPALTWVIACPHLPTHCVSLWTVACCIHTCDWPRFRTMELAGYCLVDKLATFAFTLGRLWICLDLQYMCERGFSLLKPSKLAKCWMTWQRF